VQIHYIICTRNRIHLLGSTAPNGRNVKSGRWIRRRRTRYLSMKEKQGIVLAALQCGYGLCTFSVHLPSNVQQLENETSKVPSLHRLDSFFCTWTCPKSRAACFRHILYERTHK
jgi:hypothetical protein